MYSTFYGDPYLESLSHFGVKGMHWGVRRFQNRDGSLTDRGRKRRRKEAPKVVTAEKAVPKKAEPKKTYSPDRKKPVSEMSSAELKAAIERVRLEQEYQQKVNPVQQSKVKKFMADAAQIALNDVVKPNAVKLINKYVDKSIARWEADDKAADALLRDKKLMKYRNGDADPTKMSKKDLDDVTAILKSENAFVEAKKARSGKKPDPAGEELIKALRDNISDVNAVDIPTELLKAVVPRLELEAKYNHYTGKTASIPTEEAYKNSKKKDKNQNDDDDDDGDSSSSKAKSGSGGERKETPKAKKPPIGFAVPKDDPPKASDESGISYSKIKELERKMNSSGEFVDIPIPKVGADVHDTMERWKERVDKERSRRKAEGRRAKKEAELELRRLDLKIQDLELEKEASQYISERDIDDRIDSLKTKRKRLDKLLYDHPFML